MRQPTHSVRAAQPALTTHIMGSNFNERERKRRARFREEQTAAIPQLVGFEYKPDVTRCSKTLAPGVPPPMPLALVIPTLENLVVDVCEIAARTDLDIFRDGPILFQIRTYSRNQIGAASSYRIVRLYISRRHPIDDLVYVIAQNLRKVGQYARHQYVEDAEYPQALNNDADAFAEKVLAEWKQ